MRLTAVLAFALLIGCAGAETSESHRLAAAGIDAAREAPRTEPYIRVVTSKTAYFADDDPDALAARYRIGQAMCDRLGDDDAVGDIIDHMTTALRDNESRLGDAAFARDVGVMLGAAATSICPQHRDIVLDFADDHRG